jgi:hypothetical protein
MLGALHLVRSRDEIDDSLVEPIGEGDPGERSERGDREPPEEVARRCREIALDGDGTLAGQTDPYAVEQRERVGDEVDEKKETGDQRRRAAAGCSLYVYGDRRRAARFF